MYSTLMYREKVEKIQALRQNFDIFSSTPEIPIDLVQKGCIPPLPIMDDYLLWGFSVCKKAVRAGVESLYCCTFPKNLEKGLYIALLMENRTNQYSWKEKAGIVALSRSESEIVLGKEVQSQIQTEGSFVPSTQIYIDLPDYLKTHVDKGVIDLKTGERIVSLPERVFLELKKVLASSSFSKRRQFLLMLTEVAKREAMSEDDLTVLARELSIADSPFEALRARRYPQLTAMERSIDALQSKYVHGTGIRILPPRDFEGDAFTIRFSWHSKKQLSKVIEHLKRLQEEGDEFFNLLF